MVMNFMGIKDVGFKVKADENEKYRVKIFTGRTILKECTQDDFRNGNEIVILKEMFNPEKTYQVSIFKNGKKYDLAIKFNKNDDTPTSPQITVNGAAVKRPPYLPKIAFL